MSAAAISSPAKEESSCSSSNYLASYPSESESCFNFRISLCVNGPERNLYFAPAYYKYYSKENRTKTGFHASSRRRHIYFFSGFSKLEVIVIVFYTNVMEEETVRIYLPDHLLVGISIISFFKYIFTLTLQVATFLTIECSHNKII